MVGVLRRTHAHPPQRGRSLVERRKNVRGTVVATTRSPPTVCLVDDVYTSGATVECLRVGAPEGGRRRGSRS